MIIRAYQPGRDTVRNKIVLHYNMINLLLKGTKTIVHAEDATCIRSGELLVLSQAFKQHYGKTPREYQEMD